MSVAERNPSAICVLRVWPRGVRYVGELLRIEGNSLSLRQLPREGAMYG